MGQASEWSTLESNGKYSDDIRPFDKWLNSVHYSVEAVPWIVPSHDYDLYEPVFSPAYQLYFIENTIVLILIIGTRSTHDHG